MIVKGDVQDMPPLFTSTPNSNTTHATIDSLGEQLGHSLNISSLHSASASSSHTSSSHPSISCSSLLSQDSTGSQIASIPARYEASTCPTEPSPIIYAHIRNLCGIISSNYYPTSTTSVRKAACPLGDLAAHYLAYHGYSVEIVELIIDARRRYSGEQLIMFLAGRGMALNEAKFLLLLIEHGAANV